MTTTENPNPETYDASTIDGFRAATTWTAPVVRSETVEVDGVSYPRCVRAVGIARCYGYATDGTNDCGGHGR